MMTNAHAAPDPIAAASAIVQAAAARPETVPTANPAPVIAMGLGVAVSILAIAVMQALPTIPLWCAAQGACL